MSSISLPYCINHTMVDEGEYYNPSYDKDDVFNILDTDNLLPTIEVEFNAFGPDFEVNTTNKGLTTDFRQLGLYKANFTGN